VLKLELRNEIVYDLLHSCFGGIVGQGTVVPGFILPAENLLPRGFDQPVDIGHPRFGPPTMLRLVRTDDLNSDRLHSCASRDRQPRLSGNGQAIDGIGDNDVA
jgi:hypothetical protein